MRYNCQTQDFKTGCCCYYYYLFFVIFFDEFFEWNTFSPITYITTFPQYLEHFQVCNYILVELLTRYGSLKKFNKVNN